MPRGKSVSLIQSVVGGGEGGRDSAYESGGDARRFALRCKFRILVSFRVLQNPAFLEIGMFPSSVCWR